MKKTIVLFLIVIGQLHFVNASQLIKNPKIDKRIELLSIIFRLAEGEEYNSKVFQEYNSKIETHFHPFRNHEMIDFAKELRKEKGISYDAVVSMAIRLDDNLNPIFDFSKTTPDERWSSDDAIKFVELLHKFYEDTKCNDFFESNEDLFREVESRFISVYKNLDLTWYQSFFGTDETPEDFTLLISPGCGDHSYGPSYTLPNNKKKVFAIMGIWRVDDSGIPYFKESEYLPYIIHEFAHSFVNPLNAKYVKKFEKNGNEIYKAVEYEMSKQQAYGNWEIMLNEALVRASVIKYFIDHQASETEIQQMIDNESANGFVWIEELVNELKTYDNNRDKYPSLESYISKLAIAYKSFADRTNLIESQRPKVETISEFRNNDTNVDSKIKTITINIDKPLSGNGYSINYGKKGKIAFPVIDNIYYSNENKSIVLEVQLKPNKEYQFVLFGKNFKTVEGIALKPYEVSFKTQ